MSSRELVIRHVGERMAKAFAKGDFADARSMNVFIGALEGMTDAKYDVWVDEAEASAASA